MTLSDIMRILLAVDPKLTKNWGAGNGTSYTVWTPGAITRELSDDEDGELVQRVYVDRFSREDPDPVVSALWTALEGNCIPFEYDRTTEVESKYIHHTFTCYVQVCSV